MGRWTMGRWFAPLVMATVTAVTGGLSLGGCKAGEEVFIIDLTRCDDMGEVRQVEVTIETAEGEKAEATYPLEGSLDATVGARIPAGLATPLTVSATAVTSGGDRVTLGSGSTDGSSDVQLCRNGPVGDAGPDGSEDGSDGTPPPDALPPDARPDGPPGDRPDGGDGCQPRSCEVGMCGTFDDGCGGEVRCATCGSGQTCDAAAGQCVCNDSSRTACGGTCVLLGSDSAHCGACDHTCRGGGCLNGTCQSVIVASTQNHPTEVATDESGIYWTNAGTSGMADGQVVAMPVGPAFPAATTLLADAVNGPTQLSLGDTEAFVLVGGSLVRLAKDGGHMPEAIPNADGFSLTSTFDGFVYMAEYGGGVARLAWDAGAVGVARAVAHYGIAGMVAGAEGLFFLCYECSPVSLYNFETNQVTDLVSSGVQANIKLSASAIYWDSFDGSIMTSPRTGGTAAVFATAPASTQVLSLAVDDTHVYWIWETNGSARVYRQRQEMDVVVQPEVLDEDEFDATRVAVGPLGVVWTRASRGEVVFLAR